MFKKRSFLYLLAALYTVAALAFPAQAIHAKGKGTIASLPANDQNAQLPFNTTTTKRQAVLTTANDLIGTPYIWGGNDLSGFDCSGFIEYIFKANGLYMPRTTNQQQYFGQPVDVNNVQPGDLYFFEEDDQVYHVALALADGYYLHAPSPGKSVSYGHVGRFAPRFANRVINDL